MSETHVKHAVERLANELRAEFLTRLVSVRLFGSWARGEATPDSDVDVCAVIQGLTRPEKIRIFERAAELGWETACPLSVLAMDEAEFNKLLELEARLALDIVNEGVPA